MEPADREVTDVAAEEWAEWMAQIHPMRSEKEALAVFGPTDLQLNRAETSNTKADHVSNPCMSCQDSSHTPSWLSPQAQELKKENQPHTSLFQK